MKIGGLRVDTQEVQGPFCKVAGIKEFPDLIYNKKFCGPSLRCGGPRAALVHGGPRTRPQMSLVGGWSERCPHAWNLATVEEEGGGNGGEPHRLEEGWLRDGEGRASVVNNRWRRRSGVERREAERGPVKLEVGAHPFIGVGEGHAGARKGETAGDNGLNAIEGGRLNDGLRGGGGN
jgi:hypothetical protein